MNELLRKTIDAVAAERYPDLSKEGKEILAESLTIKEAYKGELILKQDEVADSILMVGKGMLRQFYYKNGKDITEHFSYENSVVICIESFLKQEPTRLMIEALEPSTVFALPYARLNLLVETYPELNRFYRGILEYALIVSQVKADSWRFETAKERYNRLLKQDPEIIRRAPLAHIASYLLMTPETLSRVRSNL